MHPTRPVLSAVTGLLLLSGDFARAEELKTPKEKVSYGLGVEVARNFKKSGVEIDIDLMIQGLRDTMAGNKLLAPEAELRPLVRMFQAEARKNTIMSMRAAAESNKKKGDAFLAANKSKEGVVALPSGVQYKILKAGSGPKATDADFIECDYRGSLLDGTEFDRSETGKPARLKVSSLIAGWKEAIKLMPVGSKWQLFIPSELGYGTRGVGSDIGPNEMLIFEVELFGVKAH